MGAALVLVLIVTLLLGLMAVALAFTVTLDGLSARNVQEAALAEGAAEGALQLAAAWVGEARGEGTPSPASLGAAQLGGIDAEVTVSDRSDRLELAAMASVGGSTVTRDLTLRFDDAGVPLVESRP